MRTWILLLLALCASACSGTPEPAPTAPEKARTWSFEGDAEGAPPAGFDLALTGGGAVGKWVVRGGVLVQEDPDDTELRFPMAVAEGEEPADLRLSVRCRMVSGEVDRAAGLVFRWRSDRNYYLTRANALEGNVRLYAVENGVRRTLASFDGAVTAGEWHTLAVEARGDVLRVSFDGKQVLEAKDGTFPGPGRVGVWTKSDSVTQFDDLRVER